MSLLAFRASLEEIGTQETCEHAQWVEFASSATSTFNSDVAQWNPDQVIAMGYILGTWFTLLMLRLLSTKAQGRKDFQNHLLTPSCWYSLESSRWVLSDKYPCARVSIIANGSVRVNGFTFDCLLVENRNISLLILGHIPLGACYSKTGKPPLSWHITWEENNTFICMNLAFVVSLYD